MILMDLQSFVSRTITEQFFLLKLCAIIKHMYLYMKRFAEQLNILM